jgi:hypothetical protein
MQIELTELDLPHFGLPTQQPTIPAETYRQRIANLCKKAQAAGYGRFLVYGDREHFGNLTFLTGFDPRFEEAMLILDPSGEAMPQLLVGNEGFGYANISPIADQLDVILYQPFSLLGQDRSKSAPLATILEEAGIEKETAVGVAGWKHYSSTETNTPQTWLEIPSYIVDTLREMVGDPALVQNANGLLMDATDGLRANNDVDQFAIFEFAATHSSQALRNVYFGVKPGMTELEAVSLMGLNGLPNNCHTMLSTGERAFLGMGSPSSRIYQCVGNLGGVECAGWLYGQRCQRASCGDF